MTAVSKLGFDEVIDTVADVVESADLIVEALKDGFQFTDLGQLLMVAPKVQEVKRDGAKAVAQFLDLDGDEAIEAGQRLAERLTKTQSLLLGRISEAFTLVARSYREVTDIRNLGNDWKLFARSLQKTSLIQA